MEPCAFESDLLALPLFALLGGRNGCCESAPFLVPEPFVGRKSSRTVTQPQVAERGIVSVTAGYGWDRNVGGLVRVPLEHRRSPGRPGSWAARGGPTRSSIPRFPRASGGNRYAG